MFINKNSLQITISGKPTLNLGQYLLEAKYGYNKLWSEDSGRNLKGTQSGTLLGIFPKIICQFRRLTQTELETIAPYLDAPIQTISYYDINKKAQTNITTYSGDYEIDNTDIGQNKGFQISFISVSKR